MDKGEILTNIGFILAGLLAGWIAYYSKKPSAPPQTDTVMGVGLELGNRLQVDLLIAELRRCADALSVLADRKQATQETKLDKILQELAEAEEREIDRVARLERARRPTRPRKPRGQS